MRLLVLAFTIVSLMGCVAPTPLPVFTATLEYERPDWFESDVTGSVEGSAFFRTQGGDVRTCAGNEVSAVPVTPYASERMQFIYGNTSGGAYIRKIDSAGSTPMDKNYRDDALTTLCDVSGRFEFQDIPVGSYYVTSTVVWQVGYANHGGPVFKRIEVEEGKTTRVVVSP